MKKEASAFSLVELMVGITISMLIMISVGEFISVGIRNVSTQNTVISNLGEDAYFFSHLFDVLGEDAPIDSVIFSASGAIVKSTGNTYNNIFAYIGEKSMTGIVCDTDSSLYRNNHLFIKQFFPFEGEGGDLGVSTTYEVGSIKIDYFAGSATSAGVSFTGDILGPTNAFLTGSVVYLVDTDGDKIVKGDTTAMGTPVETIVGKGTPGSEFTSGQDGTDIFLNTPTGITLVGSDLLISDTANNRIIQYDTISKKVSLFMDESDGLLEPTGLFYDTGNIVLYIANSGKGEILKIDAKGYSAGSNFNFPFTLGNTSNVERVEFQFFTGSGAPFTVSPSLSQTDYNFSGFTNTNGAVFASGSNAIDYYFSNFIASPTAFAGCNVGEYKLSGTTPVECVGTGTGSIGPSTSNSFMAGTSYGVTINNLSFSATSTGSYYTEIGFYQGAIKINQTYVQFFIKGDDSIKTKGDNRVSIFASGLSYPTGVFKNGVHIQVNDLYDRKKITYDTNGSLISSSDLLAINYTSLAVNSRDVILKNPVSSVLYNKNGNLLTLGINSYKNFSCYEEKQNILQSTYVKKKVK